MIVQQVKQKAIFQFTGLPIVMLDNKSIYHVEKKRIINKKLNCRSLGYWIDRRFYTLSKLNKLSKKVSLEILVNEIVDCPF